MTAALIIASAALVGASAPAMASPARDDSPSVTMTVDGVDYPVCAEEDCSDQVGQVGVWFSKSTGHWLLELGEHFTRVIDASVDQG
jgi:hypothetical protein